MATTPTSSNILSGIQSVQGNRHASRLSAYNDNLAERQAYDTTSELLAGQIQQQEKQNKFISNALGIKNSPDHTKMWNSHHALLSEEYEAMFNDDVLKAVSQDEMLSAKWLADLNELNKRINEAEQFFSISFGDPSKGPDQASYSGWMQATQDGNIEYNDYWKGKGLSTTVTNQEFKDRAAKLDKPSHESVTYIPGQGFDVKYVGGSEDVFDFSPKNASEWFFAPTEQAVFNPPVNYSNESSLYTMFENNGADAVRENLQSRKTTPSVQLDVAEFARKRAIEEAGTDEERKKLEATTTKDYRDKLVDEGTFNTEYNLFEDAVVEGMNTREQRQKEKKAEEEKNKKGSQGSDGRGRGRGAQYKDLPGLVNGIAQVSGLDKVQLEGEEEMASIRSFRLENGALQVGIQVGDGDVNFTNVNESWASYFDGIYGPGFAEKMKAKLSGGGSTTSRTTDGNAR